MKHYMKLNDEPFEDMKNGSKTLEIRLNDPKRQLVNIGDHIIFQKITDLRETIEVSVLKLQKYKSRQELILDNPISSFGKRYTGYSYQQLINKGSNYTKEQEEKFEYLAIYIQKI